MKFKSPFNTRKVLLTGVALIPQQRSLWASITSSGKAVAQSQIRITPSLPHDIKFVPSAPQTKSKTEQSEPSSALIHVCSLTLQSRISLKNKFYLKVKIIFIVR